MRAAQSRSREITTDLYELTMAASYFEQGMFAPATFSLFVRHYPPNRSYFVSAGLDDLLDYLESFHFQPDDLEYLERTSLFSSKFLAFLEKLRFTGHVRAVHEGRIFFATEPLVEITAPLIEAQLARPRLSRPGRVLLSREGATGPPIERKYPWNYYGQGSLIITILTRKHIILVRNSGLLPS